MKTEEPESLEEVNQNGDPLIVPAAQPSPPKSPEDSRKLIQKQLVLLLHAHACQKKDVGVSAENRLKCPVPNCEMMKDVWQHIKVCRVGLDCTHLHCSSSLKILAHWKHCKVVECPVCHLVRLKGAQFTQAGAVQQNGSEISGQSTNGLAQGQSHCQGQPVNQPQAQAQVQQHQPLQRSQPQQMKPGSDGCNCYMNANCSVRGIGSTTCPFPAPQNQNIPFFEPPLQQQPQMNMMMMRPNNNTPMRSPGFKGTYPSGGIVLQNDMNSGVKVTLRGNLTRKHCQCLKCTGRPNGYGYGQGQSQQQQPQGGNVPYGNGIINREYSPNPRNIPLIPIPGQLMKNRKRSADAYQVDYRFRSRHKSNGNEAPAPSANDVRRAYEQLGIPCPSDALKRLMATLPGGSKLVQVQEEEDRQRNQGSSDEDDGINVDYMAQDDVPSSSWCLSLVKRLSANGQHVTAASS